MYRPQDIARFALSEFDRGLLGLTEAEATTRMTKADGSQMNAITWVIGHVSDHWLWISSGKHARRAPEPPPSLPDMLALLAEAKASQGWIEDASEAHLAELRPELMNETRGIAILRAVQHTWFHIGEVNAVRQMLGHAEIPFVGPMAGIVEWRPAGSG